MDDTKTTPVQTGVPTPDTKQVATEEFFFPTAGITIVATSRADAEKQLAAQLKNK